LRDGQAFQGQQWREREGKNELTKEEEGEGYLYPSHKNGCYNVLVWIIYPKLAKISRAGLSGQNWSKNPAPIWLTGTKVLNINSRLKKLQYENGDNFFIRTLFSMILGSLESPQQALQLYL
jgi:hypothetical protein